MFRRFSVNFALLAMTIDAGLVCLALYAATGLRPALSFLPFAAEYPYLVHTPWMVYPVFAAIWVAVLFQFSVYDGRKNLRPVDEFVRLTLGSLLATVAMAGALYLSYRLLSRLLFGAFVILAYLGMLAWRPVARWLFQRRDRLPGHQRRVLIVGAGKLGRELQLLISTSDATGSAAPHLQVIGFLDDDSQKRQEHPDVLGTLDEAARLVEELHPDDVAIALPARADERMGRLVQELHQLPVKVWVIPDYFRLALHKAAVEEFGGLVMLDLRAPALSDTQRLVKRAFDLLVTLLSLPVALPLGGLITLAIWLESGRPALFFQQRVGENGRLFQMIKFRSMQPGADELRHLAEVYDEHGKLVYKRADDPRVTRLGHFLRRTSLDELPQLYNVLKGEMSLVGPRPELPYLVAQYEAWQRQRFAVPQGITGWWQVNGRSDRPMHLNTEYDLYYVQNYSLLLDLYILIKTAGAVLIGRGAF